jgi:hypothetical protein
MQSKTDQRFRDFENVFPKHKSLRVLSNVARTSQLGVERKVTPSSYYDKFQETSVKDIDQEILSALPSWPLGLDTGFSHRQRHGHMQKQLDFSARQFWRPGAMARRSAEANVASSDYREPHVAFDRRNDFPEAGWRAGDAARTRDIFLGKEVLYQLSYTRTFSKRGRNDASGTSRIK